MLQESWFSLVKYVHSLSLNGGTLGLSGVEKPIMHFVQESIYFKSLTARLFSSWLNFQAFPQALACPLAFPSFFIFAVFYYLLLFLSLQFPLLPNPMRERVAILPCPSVEHVWIGSAMSLSEVQISGLDTLPHRLELLGDWLRVCQGQGEGHGRKEPLHSFISVAIPLNKFAFDHHGLYLSQKFCFTLGYILTKKWK